MHRHLMETDGVVLSYNVIINNVQSFSTEKEMNEHK